MHRFNLHRTVAIAAVASLALLAGATSASAKLPSLQIDLQAGPLATDVQSDAVQDRLNQLVGGELGKVQRRLSSTQQRLRRSKSQLRSIERKLGSQAKSTTGKARSKLNRAKGRAVSKVRSLRRQVKRLSRRTQRLARQAQSRAIARARSAVNGAYVVVSRSGEVLDQSGGITVSQAGAGAYRVAWDMSRPSCFDLVGAGSASSPVPATVVVTPAGAGSLLVTTGLAQTGFYLTAVC
jgi:hypothetical protein